MKKITYVTLALMATVFANAAFSATKTYSFTASNNSKKNLSYRCFKYGEAPGPWTKINSAQQNVAQAKTFDYPVRKSAIAVPYFACQVNIHKDDRCYILSNLVFSGAASFMAVPANDETPVVINLKFSAFTVTAPFFWDGTHLYITNTITGTQRWDDYIGTATRAC